MENFENYYFTTLMQLTKNHPLYATLVLMVNIIIIVITPKFLSSAGSSNNGIQIIIKHPIINFGSCNTGTIQITPPPATPSQSHQNGTCRNSKWIIIILTIIVILLSLTEIYYVHSIEKRLYRFFLLDFSECSRCNPLPDLNDPPLDPSAPSTDFTDYNDPENGIVSGLRLHLNERTSSAYLRKSAMETADNAIKTLNKHFSIYYAGEYQYTTIKSETDYITTLWLKVKVSLGDYKNSGWISSSVLLEEDVKKLPISPFSK